MTPKTWTASPITGAFGAELSGQYLRDVTDAREIHDLSRPAPHSR